MTVLQQFLAGLAFGFVVTVIVCAAATWEPSRPAQATPAHTPAPATIDVPAWLAAEAPITPPGLARPRIDRETRSY